jgi:hypothetical protein
MAERLTREALEIVVLPLAPAARLTQAAVETAGVAPTGTINVLLSRIAYEVAVGGYSPRTLLTQLGVEVAEVPSGAAARLSRVGVEAVQVPPTATLILSRLAYEVAVGNYNPRTLLSRLGVEVALNATAAAQPRAQVIWMGV